MDQLELHAHVMNILMPHIRIHGLQHDGYDDYVESMIEEKNIEKHEQQAN